MALRFENVELLNRTADAVLKDALPRGGRQDGVGLGCLPYEAISFVVTEVEQLVFHDRAADETAELVEIQGRSRDAIFVIEPVVGSKVAVPVEPICGAVDLI